MDEAELEDWYAQAREKLEEQAMAALQKGDARAQQRFDAEYRKLILDYQRRQQAIYAGEKRSERIQKPIARMRNAIADWSRRPGIWASAQRKRFQKWWFDRKVRRLLR